MFGSGEVQSRPYAIDLRHRRRLAPWHPGIPPGPPFAAQEHREPTHGPEGDLAMVDFRMEGPRSMIITVFSTDALNNE